MVFLDEIRIFNKYEVIWTIISSCITCGKNTDNCLYTSDRINLNCYCQLCIQTSLSLLLRRLGVIEWMDKTAPLKELLAEELSEVEKKYLTWVISS